MLVWAVVFVLVLIRCLGWLNSGSICGVSLHVEAVENEILLSIHG